jgi:hypothetical protein
MQIKEILVTGTSNGPPDATLPIGIGRVIFAGKLARNELVASPSE